MNTAQRNYIKKLCRGDEGVEVHPETWAKILLFLTKCGWRPSVPSYYFLSSDYNVSEEDARSIAAAGQIVLEETLKDPLAAFSNIDFDMDKFAEIICFCENGAFRICR